MGNVLGGSINVAGKTLGDVKSTYRGKWGVLRSEQGAGGASLAGGRRRS